jgi:hypothetical protein
MASRIRIEVSHCCDKRLERADFASTSKICSSRCVYNRPVATTGRRLKSRDIRDSPACGFVSPLLRAAVGFVHRTSWHVRIPEPLAREGTSLEAVEVTRGVSDLPMILLFLIVKSSRGRSGDSKREETHKIMRRRAGGSGTKSGHEVLVGGCDARRGFGVDFSHGHAAGEALFFIAACLLTT